MNASREHGAAAVEFALVIPVLMLMIFGIVEGGTRFAQQSQINHAAFLAARAMSIDPSLTASNAVSAVYSGTISSVNGTQCPTDGTTPLVQVTINSSRASVTGMFFSYSLKGVGVARCQG